VVEISVSETGKVTGGGQVIGYAGESGCRKISFTSYPEIPTATYWILIDDGENVTANELSDGIYTVSTTLLSISRVLIAAFMAKSSDGLTTFISEPFKLIVAKSLKFTEPEA